MKTNRIIAALIVLVVMLSLGVVTAFALNNQTVVMAHTNTSNSIEAGFLESQKGTGSYGTDTTRVIKQCYVRLQEGNYDSGRVYSDVGVEKGGTEYIWIKTSKSNNIFYTCYTHYGWFYY